MPDQTLRAEDIHIVERLIVAPRAGLFAPSFPELSSSGPEPVVVGEEVGVVVHMDEKYPVCSRFSGWLMGLLVLPGERVRADQPVAWLRPLGEPDETKTHPLRGSGQETDREEAS